MTEINISSKRHWHWKFKQKIEEKKTIIIELNNLNSLMKGTYLNILSSTDI